MQPINVTSSENLIKRTDWSPETQSFVNRVNKKGDNTHPCGAPVLIMTGEEIERLCVRSKQNVRDKVGPLEDNACNIITQGFLMAEELNMHVSVHARRY